MTRLILIAALLALAFLFSPAQAQEFVDVIVKVDTPEKGASPTINGKRMLNAYPLLADKLKTVYLYRVSQDAVDIRLKPYFTAAKNGDVMYSGLDAWNKFQAAEQALAEKVLVYEKTDVAVVDGKPAVVTESVTLEEARVSVIDLDVTKVSVPVKFSGTVPAIKPEELKDTAVSAEDRL